MAPPPPAPYRATSSNERAEAHRRTGGNRVWRGSEVRKRGRWISLSPHSQTRLMPRGGSLFPHPSALFSPKTVLRASTAIRRLMTKRSMQVANALSTRFQGLLENVAPYSDERDNLAMALFGASEVLSVDQDGRTVLPERLREFVGIKTRVTFVGLGDKFQLWEPERFEDRFSEGREKLNKLRKLLGAGRRGSGDAEGGQER